MDSGLLAALGPGMTNARDMIAGAWKIVRDVALLSRRQDHDHLAAFEARLHLDLVETGFLRGGERVGDRYGAFVGAVLLDQMDFADANLLVDARPILAGRLLGSHRATNGDYLLCCCDGPVPLRPICGNARRKMEDRYKAAGSQRRTGCAALLCGGSLQIDQAAGRATSA